MGSWRTSRGVVCRARVRIVWKWGRLGGRSSVGWLDLNFYRLGKIGMKMLGYYSYRPLLRSMSTFSFQNLSTS